MTFSLAPLVRLVELSLGTFDKGAKRARTGSFPRDNCPELFQSGVGTNATAAHKNVTPFKARVKNKDDGGG